jgi:hypothetical protein
MKNRDYYLTFLWHCSLFIIVLFPVVQLSLWCIGPLDIIGDVKVIVFDPFFRLMVAFLPKDLYCKL